MKKLLFFIFCFSFIVSFGMAQEAGKGSGKDFEWRLIGRALFDGGGFWCDRADLGNSFQVNDLRLGTRIRFLEDWEAKIEIAYGHGKISLKDVYLNYTLSDKHYFRLGYYFEPFGYAVIGSVNFRFIAAAGTDKALGNKRKLGISYRYNQPHINVMAGVFSEGDIDKAKSVDQGYAMVAKLIGRPVMEEGRVVHLGIAPRFSRHEKEIGFKAGIPTDLLSSEDNSFIQAEIGNMINMWKFEAELIAIYRKWYFEGRYMMAHVNRTGPINYTGQGGYVQGGYMILGEKHNYNPLTGYVVNPAPKSLEALVRYNRTNLTDAGIRGGKMDDITLGVNYFINKYVAAKLNYSYVIAGANAFHEKDRIHALQARVQFSF